MKVTTLWDILQPEIMVLPRQTNIMQHSGAASPLPDCWASVICTPDPSPRLCCEARMSRDVSLFVPPVQQLQTRYGHNLPCHCVVRRLTNLCSWYSSLKKPTNHSGAQSSYDNLRRCRSICGPADQPSHVLHEVQLNARLSIAMYQQLKPSSDFQSIRPTNFL